MTSSPKWRAALLGFALLTMLLTGSAARAESGDSVFVETLNALEKSPTGSALVAQAEKAWGLEPGSPEIRNFLKWGEASKTDAVLTRYLNPKTGEERRERRVSIYMKRGQTRENMILDLAHELVHAATRPVWDPYDPTLTPSRYIQSAIDGPGGEVDAVIAECRVGLELRIDLGSSAARCQSYFDPGRPADGVIRDRVTSDFYRSGVWAEALRKRLGAEGEKLLPRLSGDAPVLYSSTGKLPYPMALYEEFLALTEIACRNSEGRLTHPSAPIRTLASQFVSRRCQSILGSHPER